MAGVLDAFHNPTTNNYFELRYSSTIAVRVAQQFIPAHSGYVNKVELQLLKKADPTGNMWISIWSDNGSDLPSAQIGSASNTVDIATVTDTTPPGETILFTFAGTDALVTASTKYWIVLEGDYTPATDHHIGWCIENTGTYADGIMARYHSSWSADSANDGWFNEYYIAVAGISITSWKTLLGVGQG